MGRAHTIPGHSGHHLQPLQQLGLTSLLMKGVSGRQQTRLGRRQAQAGRKIRSEAFA